MIKSKIEREIEEESKESDLKIDKK